MILLRKNNKVYGVKLKNMRHRAIVGFILWSLSVKLRKNNKDLRAQNENDLKKYDNVIIIFL